MKIGIVADDLTGAADSAAPFADRGMRCCAVIGNRSKPRSLLVGYNAAAVSTETRDVSRMRPDVIRSAIASAVRDLNAIGRPDLLCKKIDSTLRGNLTVELSAICTEAAERIPIICPAFPAQGRVVMGGTLFVRGEPRQRVSEAIDPDLSEHSGFIDLADIRRGPECVREQLTSRSRWRAVFFDAETDSDLAIVSAVVLEDPSGWLPVGSAGFMGAIATAISPALIENPHCEQARERLVSRPVLYVCGSKSIVSCTQVAELERAGGTSRVSTIAEAFHVISAGSRVGIAASPDEEQDQSDVLENLLTGIEALHTVDSATLVVTGGATAAALLSHLMDFSHLDVLGELEPGVVVTVAVFRSSGNTHAPTTRLVLKAGAFGDVRTLARIVGL